MSGYPLFIPGFVLSTNPSLFKFKIANEHREFRNYLYNFDLRRAITRSTGYLQAGYLVELKDTKTYDPFTVTPPQSGGRVIDFLAEPFAM